MTASSRADILFAFPPAQLTFIGYEDSVYEKLELAPTDPSVYYNAAVVIMDDVFVIRTREGHYVKLKFLLPDGALVRFIYTYQDDGTPSLKTPVATRATTWGRVKSLYR